tara:strand:- start:1422 stop:3134 length:1713 start_codon:yes stop_codon:yes gene_type:complete
MSKESLQKTKNADKGVDNKKSRLKNLSTKEGRKDERKKADDKLAKLKKSLLAKLGIANVICSAFPSANIGAVIDAVKEGLNDVVKFLIDILITLLDINLVKMQKLLTKWLTKELNILSSELNFTLRNNLNSCFLCKVNPNIPNWMITEGINIEVKQIDFQDMFSIHPDSEAGKFIYGGEGDMNRFLFNVINEGSASWKNIATFSFVTEGKNVGYNESLDTANNQNEKGEQNTDKRNNVINMKINSSYGNQPLINFVNDYINSQSPIIISSKTIPNVMDLKYGLTSRLGNLSITSIRKKAEFNAAVKQLFDEGVENPDIKIDNSFTTFDKEQKDAIDRNTNEMYTGEFDSSNCCCGKSTINDGTLISFNERIEKATNDEERISIIDGGLTQIANESVSGFEPEERNKGYIEFFIDFLQNLSTVIVSMVLSPKINILVVMLYYMVNKKARFFNVKDFLKSIICVVRDIMLGILKKLIFGLLLPQLIDELTDIVKCAIKQKISRKVDEEKKSLESLLPKQNIEDAGKFAAIAKALGKVTTSLGTDGELLNSAVDVGFDSANNSTKEAIDANKS